MTESTQFCDIGFVGAGVMGKNLILNLADHGYRVAVFDLDLKKLELVISQDLLENNGQQRVVACSSYTELLSKLKQPHLVILSVPAGRPVDDVCSKLIDAGIEADDIVVAADVVAVLTVKETVIIVSIHSSHLLPLPVHHNHHNHYYR